MSESLYRLVYFSRTCLPAPSDKAAAEIRSILGASQANNGRVGVTGALMFNDDCFAQVLEGPRDAVEATFERIQQDERHGAVTLLSFDPVSSRGFPNWSMGFVGMGPDAADFADIADESGFDPSRLSGEQIYDVLTSHLLDQESAVA
jgi:hypothetical protein